ncbi:MAG: BamA/TamA family outer membrane protein [Flavobacteriales bacterium]|nr:BamA/TamA family outer membrane protein [Flavobacteriales bacterium]
MMKGRYSVYFFIALFYLLLLPLPLLSQNTIDYSTPREYTISSIEVESNSDRIDKQFVKILSGLEVGRKIKVPGDDISQAIQKLWKEKVFSNIKIYHTNAEKGKIDLVIYVEERPRLSKFSIKGVRKGEADDIKEKIKLFRGEVVTEYLLKMTEYRIKDFYAEKGFLDTEVTFTLEDDTTFSSNAVIMRITINKNEKVKVERITVEGNKHVRLSKIRRKMKDALVEKSRVDVGQDILNLLSGKIKWKDVDSTILEDGLYQAAVEYFTNSTRINIFKKSKYVKEELPNAKNAVIALYNAKGYRDAKFVKDSIYLKDGSIYADFKIDEGKKYYIRKITWVGNKRYRSGQLDTILGIKRGDVYNQEKLDQSLRFNPSGMDISSLYQDIGYLFFNIDPVEVLIEGDSVDIEMRIYEGKQARINKIIISGNTKTSDHVILREIRCNPGDLFSRSDIVRSQQALAQLGFFDAQAMDVRPIPNPADGTVDLEFVVAEAPSDQIELSGGWGAGQIIGTLGLTFNNFSLRNIFKKRAWTPLPSGDGQRLQIRAQSNGPRFQSYNFSFTEPWLGGKKPISFSLFVNHTAFAFGTGNAETNLKNTAVGISLGKQLKWPDDYFSILFSFSYQRYDALNYRLFSGTTDTYTGVSNNFTFSAQLQRNSVDDWIFPSSGSTIIASLELTPPYSSISGKDFTGAPLNERYQWLEYHKWKLQSKFFVPLTKNKKFVLMARGELGFLGYYNSQIGLTPFERFFLGGDGLTGFNIDGRDIIALRGYQNLALTPGFNGNAANAVGGAIYSKYTLEFRYLISPNPQAKIFALAFMEAGNAWEGFDDFAPFRLNRSVGAGVRIFLPMFGLLGVDYGWGFDPVRGVNEDQRQKGVFHFMIGQQF